MSLQYYEREPVSGDSPQQLVIFVHGYGSNGMDLISLAPEFADVLPDCHFVSPNAPFPFEGWIYNAYQWYGLRDRSEDAMLENARVAEPILNDFIDAQLARFNLEDKDLIVMGFSQGGMMSIHTMYRRESPCMAVVSFSGYVSGAQQLKKEIKSQPPLLMTHGDIDPVVPFAAIGVGSKSLKSLGIQVQTHFGNDLGHGIDSGCIESARNFIRNIIPAKLV